MFIFDKTKASSRKQMAIKEVSDDILVLDKNNYRAILEVSSLNFELKSDNEQDIIIDNYSYFLNSLSWPIQILIRTRQLDLDKYLNDLARQLSKEKTTVYIKQFKNYAHFIRSLVRDNRILSRRFFLIIPYSTEAKTEPALIKKQLELRADIVAKGLMRLNMQTKRLSTLEILDLFYSFYSPIEAKNQPLSQTLMSELNKQLIRSTK